MMATLSPRLLILAGLERYKLKSKLNMQPVLFQAVNSISFLSKSKKKEQPMERDEHGKLLVDPNVVVDPDDKHLAHKDQPIVQIEKRVYTEEEIETFRNKSRLRGPHHRMLTGSSPFDFDKPKFWTHKTVKYQRRIFGRYGEATGISPRICWPLENELKIRLEYESIARPFTFHEMVDKVKAMRKAEQDEIEQRAKEVEENMAKAEKIQQEYLARLNLKDKDAREALERKESLMEEVRRHFGYKIDVRDERFQEMLEKKEKEQRKAKKEAKKLARAQQQLRELSEMGKQAKSIESAEKAEAAKRAKKEEADDSDDEEKPNQDKDKK